MIDKNKLQENIRVINAKIEEAALRSSRKRGDIMLVAVTKTVAPEVVEMAIEEGIRIFGENRVQEAADKIPKFSTEVIWHMVGHLQTNKAKIAAKLFDTIHSLDSIKLAQIIDRYAQEAGKIQKCLIEVNLACEESKNGMNPGGIRRFLEEAASLRNISIIGLMTVPPYDPDPEKSRPFFRQMKELADEISGWGIQGITMQELSMGMTEDFAVAIEEGATMVRVGRGIFGERPS